MIMAKKKSRFIEEDIDMVRVKPATPEQLEERRRKQEDERKDREKQKP